MTDPTHRRIDADAFVADVRARVRFADDARARRSIEAVLDVLGTRLFENDARVVAARLPTDWAQRLGPSDDPDEEQEQFDLDELYRRVAEADAVELGRAVERTQVVCQVLSEHVDEEARAHLRLRLPPAIAELFEPHVVPEAPARGAVAAHTRDEPRNTLASGRPGSRRPLADARPPSGQTHSVAASSDPHADTKLSGARGISSERDDESLASGAQRQRSLADRDEDSG